MLLIEGKEWGPFSFSDLRSDPRITPEILAKKINETKWRPIGTIPELQSLFQDPVDLNEPDHEKPVFKPIEADDEIALNLNRQNPFFLLLLLFISILLIFLLFNVINN